MISRGRVGMVGLIVAEASLFAVFVVGGEPLDGRWRLLSWQIWRNALEHPSCNPKVILITSALPKYEMGKVERHELAALFSRRS